MKFPPKVKRISVTFDREEWGVIELAMCKRFHCASPEAVWSAVTNREVNSFLGHCIRAVCRAIVEARCMPLPLAVDLRRATEEELKRWNSRPWIAPRVDVIENLFLLQSPADGLKTWVFPTKGTRRVTSD